MGCHSSRATQLTSVEQTYRYICNTPFFTALDEHHLREFARYWKIEVLYHPFYHPYHIYQRSSLRYGQ
jgi:hypothetical protein